MFDENRFYNAREAYNALGYVSMHEAFLDTILIGEVNKSQGTWTQISSVSDIRTDRVIMSKAQAKYYGLDIIEPE